MDTGYVMFSHVSFPRPSLLLLGGCFAPSDLDIYIQDTKMLSSTFRNPSPQLLPVALAFMRKKEKRKRRKDRGRKEGEMEEEMVKGRRKSVHKQFFFTFSCLCFGIQTEIII
jgi:hypothetical protein